MYNSRMTKWLNSSPETFKANNWWRNVTQYFHRVLKSLHYGSRLGRRRERRNAVTQERLESARPLQRVGVMDSHLQPPSGSLPSGPVTFGAGGSGDPWGKPRHIRRLSEVSEVAQLCPTLYNPMDCNLLCSSVHGIFQARVLEGIAISSSRGSS